MRPTCSAAFTCTTLFSLPAFATEPAEVAQTYIDIAAAAYRGALTSAQAMPLAVNALIAAPSEQALLSARAAPDRRATILRADRG